VIAETTAIATILLLARASGARVHLCRISSAEGLAMVRDAKAQGLAVTCDVSAHHVHLCEIDIGYFDPNCRLIPPLRSQRDRDALRQGLADGTVDAICSDHTPVDDDAKELPFGEAEPGATGLELLLPLTLKWAREENIALPQALDRVTARPARLLGIEAGTIAPGRVADVCVFDPARHWRLDRQALKSLGKNTPFLGYEMQGKVRYTFVNGQLVYEG
jgi:dihydroorotase